MHNFGTVLRFELTRTLKKPTFWLSILSIPLITGIVVAIVYFSNVTTSDREEEVRNTPFSLIIQDETKLIHDTTLQALKAERTTDKQSAIEQVRTGKVDAFFYYPDDVASRAIEVYNKNDGVMDNSKYSEVAKTLKHPLAGLLTLEYSHFAVDGRPDLDMVVYNPATPEDATRIRQLIARTPKARVF